MTLHHQQKRRQYLIDHSYQLRFASRVFLVVLIAAVLGMILSVNLLWQHADHTGLPLQTPVIMSLFAIATMMLFELLVAIPLVLWLSIRQSHQVVGPLSRVQRILEAIGQGDLSKRITLREGDTLEELAETINHMAEQLQRHASSR